MLINNTMRKPASLTASLLLAGVAGLALAAPAKAEMVAALIGDSSLAIVDTAAMKVARTVTVQGVALHGVDVRPADSQLYGLTTDGKIVTINTTTGATAVKATLSEKLATGATFSVDFNPVADRLRVIGSDGSSLRINVEDGKAMVDGSLKYAEADGSKGKAPKVGAIAYTNSVAGSKETTLYDIDVSTGALVRQVPPNDGILNTIGMVGVTFSGPVAFDIKADAQGGNAGFVMADGTLHTIDLRTGAAKAVGKIMGLSGAVKDIAVLPNG